MRTGRLLALKTTQRAQFVTLDRVHARRPAFASRHMQAPRTELNLVGMPYSSPVLNPGWGIFMAFEVESAPTPSTVNSSVAPNPGISDRQRGREVDGGGPQVEPVRASRRHCHCRSHATRSIMPPLIRIPRCFVILVRRSSAVASSLMRNGLFGSPASFIADNRACR
jgi:hypothetical protein